jgi:hypothetical protein
MANDALSLRPCDSCGGPIAPVFFVVRVSQALINEPVVNRFIGMAHFFGGNVGISSVFDPGDDAFVIMGDKNKELMNEVFICNRCMFEKFSDLFVLVEKQDHIRNSDAGSGDE